MDYTMPTGIGLGHRAMPMGWASRYALWRRLSAARYALWHRAMPFGCGMIYHVLRFWQRKGQPFWLGLVLCPTLGILIIYILKQKTQKTKKYIYQKGESLSPPLLFLYIY